jgi:hypothetical protein
VCHWHTDSPGCTRMHIAGDLEPASGWQHQHTLAAMWMCWQPQVRLTFYALLFLMVKQLCWLSNYKTIFYGFFQPFLLFWGGIYATCPLLSLLASLSIRVFSWVSFNLGFLSTYLGEGTLPLAPFYLVGFFQPAVAQCPPLENRWGPWL